MDVLGEIKEAETQAEKIEQEYHAKADALISSVSSELLGEKKKREEALAVELAALRAKNTKEKEMTRQGILSQAVSESSALKAQAGANASKAVDILLKALDF